MTAGSVTALIYSHARTKKAEPEKGLAEAAKACDKPPATGNRRLAEQARKILGKHYANKYRVR
jgi:hypothetical protein